MQKDSENITFEQAQDMVLDAIFLNRFDPYYYNLDDEILIVLTGEVGKALKSDLFLWIKPKRGMKFDELLFMGVGQDNTDRIMNVLRNSREFRRIKRGK